MFRLHAHRFHTTSCDRLKIWSLVLVLAKSIIFAGALIRCECAPLAVFLASIISVNATRFLTNWLPRRFTCCAVRSFTVNADTTATVFVRKRIRIVITTRIIETSPRTVAVSTPRVARASLVFIRLITALTATAMLLLVVPERCQRTYACCW